MQFDNQNNFPPRSITKKLKELPYRDQGSHNIKLVKQTSIIISLSSTLLFNEI